MMKTTIWSMVKNPKLNLDGSLNGILPGERYLIFDRDSPKPPCKFSFQLFLSFGT